MQIFHPTKINLRLPLPWKLVKKGREILSNLTAGQATNHVKFNNRITESLRLEKTSKIPSPNLPPPCPLTPQFQNISSMGSPPLPAQPVPVQHHSEKKLFLISNLNLPCCSLRPLPIVLLLLPGRRGRPQLCHNQLLPSFTRSPISSMT